AAREAQRACASQSVAKILSTRGDHVARKLSIAGIIAPLPIAARARGLALPHNLGRGFSFWRVTRGSGGWPGAGLTPATGLTDATRPAMPCCVPADDRDSTRRLPPPPDRGTRSSRR